LPHVEQDVNEQSMCEAISNVKTGQVTYAVRDTSVSGTEIKSGDIIGIADGEISAVSSTPDEALLKLAEEMTDDDSEVITVYYGEDISDEQANDILDTLEEKYDDIDVLLQKGNQPLYYYILSVE